MHESEPRGMEADSYTISLVIVNSHSRLPWLSEAFLRNLVFSIFFNLMPRVLRLLGQRVIERDSERETSADWLFTVTKPEQN